jgi:hypothetical protein
MLKDKKPRFRREFDYVTETKTGQVADEDAGTTRYDPFGLNNPKAGTLKQ